MTHPILSSVKDGQEVYWRWRKDGREWHYATVQTMADCPSLITLVHEIEPNRRRYVVADPNDIDWRETIYA